MVLLNTKKYACGCSVATMQNKEGRAVDLLWSDCSGYPGWFRRVIMRQRRCVRPRCVRCGGATFSDLPNSDAGPARDVSVHRLSRNKVPPGSLCQRCEKQETIKLEIGVADSPTNKIDPDLISPH